MPIPKPMQKITQCSECGKSLIIDCDFDVPRVCNDCYNAAVNYAVDSLKSKMKNKLKINDDGTIEVSLKSYIKDKTNGEVT